MGEGSGIGGVVSSHVMKPLDTSADVWAVVEGGLRAMTPKERVARATSLTILCHGFALAKLRRQYPEEDERKLRMRLAARYLDKATMAKAFGFHE
jgi:hypothetical protein